LTLCEAWEKGSNFLWPETASVELFNGRLILSGNQEFAVVYKEALPDIPFTFKIEGIIGDNSGVLLYPNDEVSHAIRSIHFQSVPYFIRIVSAARYNCRIEINNKKDNTAKTIFLRDKTPAVRAFTVRVIGQAITAFWHFWDKETPDIVQETYLPDLFGSLKVLQKRSSFNSLGGHFIRAYS
jgi:hypothetical protein